MSDDGYPSERILEIIKEIKNDTTTPGKLMYYKEKYAEFSEKFPKLFYAALDPMFDIKFLKLMLSQRDKVITTKQLDTFEQVNNEVVETLNEKYLYNVFSKEQIEQAKALQEKMKNEAQNS